MTRIALYVNGGRFELAPRYSAEELAKLLSSPKGSIMTLELAGGGLVRFGVTSGLAWAVEDIA